MWIETKIEIASAPEHIREVFLDFASIPSYHSGTIKSIAPADSSKQSIEKGDKFNCAIAGLKFTPTIVESSPSELSWQGAPSYIMRGFHVFRFEPSEITPGWTTFVQNEEFTGLLAFVMHPSGPAGKSVKAGYEQYNRDLKARVESQKAT